jgi:serine/threonine protein kinase
MPLATPALEPEMGAFWGSFRIISKVGQGAFGEVFRAWDATLEREAALKLLLPRGLKTEEQAQNGNPWQHKFV